MKEDTQKLNREKNEEKETWERNRKKKGGKKGTVEIRYFRWTLGGESEEINCLKLDKRKLKTETKN